MDEGTKFIKTLCKRIRNGKFAWEKYQNGGAYYGREIQTERMVCSYGMCGFDIWFPYSNLPSIQWDWELRELTIDDLDYKTWLYWQEHYTKFYNEWFRDKKTELDFVPYVQAKHNVEVPKKIVEDW